MSFLNKLFGKKDSASTVREGAINYGKNTSTGDHDHRTNKGGDRTPAQKDGDKRRRKD